VTVLGRAEKTDDPRLKARFVARHPSAALYADFGDFHLYRVATARAHFVAGFGRIHWIEAADLVFDASASALADAEETLIPALGKNADRLAQLATGRRRKVGALPASIRRVSICGGKARWPASSCPLRRAARTHSRPRSRACCRPPRGTRGDRVS
jgi:hypothetical protein